jgi:hypothetical protein
VRIAAVGSRGSDIVLTGDVGGAARLLGSIAFDSGVRSNVSQVSQWYSSE